MSSGVRENLIPDLPPSLRQLGSGEYGIALGGFCANTEREQLFIGGEEFTL